MKTLLFTIEYPPFKGGVANYYGNIVKYWPDKSSIFVLDGKNNRLLSKRLRPPWLKAFVSLQKEIKANRIDHVIVGHILPLGTVAYYLSKFCKFDYSVALHGMDIQYAMKKRRKKIMAKKILKKAKVIICNSSFVQGLAKDFLGEDYKDKIKVVNPGIMPQGMYKAGKVKKIKQDYNPDNKFLLFTVSRLVKRKGHDMVIKALDFLSPKYSDIIYAAAGTGPDEKYLKELAKNKKNIVFLGNITEEDKWAWLRACDVFIMPSRVIEGDVEGFGIVYLEAAIAGKPVIAGRSGGAEDAVIDEETGLLAYPDSPEDIAEAITELQNSWSRRYEMGQRAQKRALEQFLWPRQAEKFYQIINN